MIESMETPARGDEGDDTWLAWRYLLAELDPSEAAAFEDRLAVDEAAAAALVDAVRLRQAIAEAREVGGRRGVATPHSPIGRWRVVLMGAVTTACAVALLVAWTTGRRLHDSDHAAQLVRLWSVAPIDLPLGDDMLADDAAEAGDDVPAWLLTAVTLEQERRAAEASDAFPNEQL